MKKVLDVLAAINVILFFAFAMALDSESMIPIAACGITAAYLGIYAKVVMNNAMDR